MDKELEILVEKAVSGDKKALEKVISNIQDLVYNLALKMLLFSEDAQDATQEILVRVITRLSTYKQQSQFTTWVYRVAVNYLLTTKGKMSQKLIMDFDEYAKFIDTKQSAVVTYAKNEGELSLLEEEVKVSCTHGLLLCLNAQSRCIYILGDILEMNSMLGAEILDITPENFRKQLSRARANIRGFLSAKCGLINAKNACRCKKKIDFLADQQMIDSSNLRFAQATQRSIDLIKQIDTLENIATVYQVGKGFNAPEELVQKMKETIQSFT